MAVVSKGHLNPGAPGISMARFVLATPPDPLADVVRHLWFGRWKLPPGVVRPQRVLSYPAANLVIAPEGALLAGLGTAVGVQELRGESWVLGALLRPAATRLFTERAPRELLGARTPVAGAPLAEVTAAVRDGGDPDALKAAVRAWLEPFARGVDERMRLCNEVCRIAEEDALLTRVDELAERAGLPLRSLDRLVREHVGASPKWLLDCRRLQEAATMLYAGSGIRLAELALCLGFSDQAHFTRSYRKVIGETPTRTREAGEDARAQGWVPPRLR